MKHGTILQLNPIIDLLIYYKHIKQDFKFIAKYSYMYTHTHTHTHTRRLTEPGN